VSRIGALRRNIHQKRCSTLAKEGNPLPACRPPSPWPELVVALLVASTVGLGASGPTPTVPTAAALRAKALELGYNLDHEQALATFKASIAADPDAPAGYRLAAATIWIALLFEQGVITVEDYLGQARADVARTAPRAELAAQFHDYLHRARTLAERQLREHPDDPDAHFQVGAAYGFEASYTATVEGRVLASVGPARRAFAEHGRVLELNPARRDAGLIVGMYRCAVAELSGLPRLFAFLSGFRGDRDLGLRLVGDAARYPSEVQPNALFTLVLLYNRAGRYDDALGVIRQLQARYPRNRLLRLEAGGTALRAKRPAEARGWLEEGLAQLATDPRPKAPGEDARWRYTYGAALVALKDVQPAERELRAALAGVGRDWLRGRIHKELGKLADLAGDRSRARGEYEQAGRFCRQDKDSACADEVKALLKTPYR
jgi:tetratricopeptide (TPR) repeat protein